jgi:hypothetical protein
MFSFKLQFQLKIEVIIVGYSSTLIAIFVYLVFNQDWKYSSKDTPKIITVRPISNKVKAKPFLVFAY